MNKFTYALISLLIFSHMKGQLKEFPINKGNCQLFNGNLYTYGILTKNQNLVFCIYKLDQNLKSIDSVFIDAGKNLTENYLNSYSDTLHDYLNIYFQKKSGQTNSTKKDLSILRFNKKFELIAKIENVDIARLNNTSLFSNEMYYFKNTVYSIKTESDTSGKQFYLNKYQLQSDSVNFDYEFKWQFPFERKNIHSAHIIYADQQHVFLFVTVVVDIKAGEWLLKIDAKKGELRKATKFNKKGDTDSYFFGDVSADKTYKSMRFIGQKFTEIQFSRATNKLQISKATFADVYYIEIDSIGEIVVREEFKIPISDIKTGVKKETSNFLLRFSNLKKHPDGKISFTGDVFKSYNSNVCYLYSNTTFFNLVPSEDLLLLEKNTLAPNISIEQYYQTLDKLDLNGKVCIDSVKQFETIFYKPVNFPVKQHVKLDLEKNLVWILSKHTTKNNLVNYSFLSPVKKIYKITTIEDIKESLMPTLTTISSESFVITGQTEDGKYQLKLYKW